MLDLGQIVNNVNSILFLNYLAVPIILMIGLIVTLGDIKEGKIKNKWIRSGIYLGLLYYILMILITIFGSYKLERNFSFLGGYELSYLYFSWGYYPKIILNTLIAFILGFVLWHFKLWAGGDAKLFALYVFLIPLEFYGNWNFKYWPALALFINIILPIFIYLLFKFLLYPIQLGINYLKNPKLLKEYYKKTKEKNKIDKTKIKEYLGTGVSFLVILIFFQILRTRINNFIDPYLGQFVTASYLFMGFVVFKPLRALLQKRVILVSILILVYLVVGYIYFRNQVFSELHKLFALQMIFMMSYFYIFKYGKIIGQYLYNSTEVRMIPVNELQAGAYINKEYIKQLLGNRANYDDFNKQIESALPKDDYEALAAVIKQKTDKTSKDKQQYQMITLFSHLRLDALPRLIRQIWEYRKQRQAEKILLEKVNSKLNDEQKQKLENILKNTDDVGGFLKAIKGKLTIEQAEKLKLMIQERNEEISKKGMEPVNHIILHKTFSFAPFMLLGVVITIITKSSLIHLIYQYFLQR